MSIITRFLRRRRLSRLKAENYRAGLSIGRHTYGVNTKTVMLPSIDSPLKMGNFCSVAAEALLMCAGHHFLESASTFPISELLLGTKLPATDYGRAVGITIGHDVWIGQRAMILPGVTIGDGAVIGACAVVAKDVAPYAIVVGNPGRTIRYRFDGATIEKLLAIRWWNWDDAKIKAESDWLLGPIDAFVSRHYPASAN